MFDVGGIEDVDHQLRFWPNIIIISNAIETRPLTRHYLL